MTLSACVRNTSAACLLLLAVTFSARAQQTTPVELLEDFTHYALTANVDLAAANAQALLDLPLSDAELAALLDEGSVQTGKFDRAVGRAMMVPELENVAAELARRIELGRLDMARDRERIDQAIGMLMGTQRAKLLAKNRLLSAGEYAVPALLREITEGNDEGLKLACQEMIRQIGRQAVTPLCEALSHLGAVNQRTVCDLLGDIGWNHAAPYLREISLDESASGPVRAAAARAFANTHGTDTDLSTLFTILGREYFEGIESLIAYPDEPFNNIWTFDSFVGLVATPVATEIYTEVMTMRMVAKAIELDSNNQTAISLFVGANLKRENELPMAETDPIFGDLSYTPDFYATVFGTQVCQDVLGMALDQKDTPLVRDAISALAKTTGGSNLFTGSGRQPLLECLEYPDRRVQYESALTLARALPVDGFAGDFWVVPLLSSAVRSGSQSFALVIADDNEDQQNLVNRLQALDFSIVGAGGSVRELTGAINEATGIDLIVVQRTSATQARQTITALEQIAKSAVAPILVHATGVDRPALNSEYRGHMRVAIVRTGLSETALADVVEDLLVRAAGGRMSEAEADAYAIEALESLRDIAISRNPVYNITDAFPALRDALGTRYGGTREWVMDILALMSVPDAQRRLFDAALVDGDEQQIELLERCADSVKRYGNMAEQRHIAALVDLVMNSDGEIAEAAARVHGALNLSSSTAIQLIPH